MSARHLYALVTAPPQNGTAHFNGEVASVDVVSEKQIPRVCRVASNFEELHKVELIDRASEYLDVSSPSRLVSQEQAGGSDLRIVHECLRILCRGPPRSARDTVL